MPEISEQLTDIQSGLETSSLYIEENSTRLSNVEDKLDALTTENQELKSILINIVSKLESKNGNRY